MFPLSNTHRAGLVIPTVKYSRSLGAAPRSYKPLGIRLSSDKSTNNQPNFHRIKLEKSMVTKSIETHPLSLSPSARCPRPSVNPLFPTTMPCIAKAQKENDEEEKEEKSHCFGGTSGGTVTPKPKHRPILFKVTAGSAGKCGQ